MYSFHPSSDTFASRLAGSANRRRVVLGPTLALGAIALAFTGCATTPSPSTEPAGAAAITELPKAVDWRRPIAAADFANARPGEWESPDIVAEFPFDELIYSWNARLPDDQGFRLYLKVGFGRDDESPWLYAGYWGTVTDPATGRTDPVFDRGHIAMDQLLLKEKARSFQYRVVDKGKSPLTVLPSLMVIATDNRPTAELAARYTSLYPAVVLPDTILDLPLRRQADSNGNPLANRCQSAALASAMEYFGNSVPIETIIPYTHDPEYNYPGIWPRTIGAAVQLGFDAYIDRFRDWTAVRQTLAQNKVILCSIVMPAKGDYIAPPYPSITGHIVALNGLTDDGRVIVTDSALAKSGRGYRCQWMREDFEKVWMQNKGGVGMVICPPEKAVEKTITTLPPFPTEERKAVRVDFNTEL